MNPAASEPDEPGEPPYPLDTTCPAEQHFNRAVLRGGAVNVWDEAELLQLWLHTAIERGRGRIVLDAGSRGHYNLCRLVHGIRALPVPKASPRKRQGKKAEGKKAEEKKAEEKKAEERTR